MPQNKKSHSDLFAVPGDFLTSAKARRVCRMAQADYKAMNPKRRDAVPVLSLDELRAIARALAPFVRECVNDATPITTVVYDPSSGRESDAERVEVAPVLAHFAFVALALLEAEEGERP